MASAVHGGIGYFGLWLSTSYLLEMNKRIDTSMVLFTYLPLLCHLFPVAESILAGVV
jgi:hypothetical protein